MGAKVLYFIKRNKTKSRGASKGVGLVSSPPLQRTSSEVPEDLCLLSGEHLGQLLILGGKASEPSQRTRPNNAGGATLSLVQ